MLKTKNIIAILGLLLILTLGLFSQPWGDDFCTMFLRSKHSPFSYAMHFYQNRDGRFLTFFMQSLLSFNVKVAKYSVYIWISFFLLLNYLVLIFLTGKEKAKNLWAFFFITIIFWIGFRRHIAETVYWSTGGGYVFATWLGLAWIYLYDKLNLDKVKTYLYWGLFSFIAGLTSFSLSPALLTYAFYDRIHAYYLNRDLRVFKDTKFLFSMVLLLAGTVVMVVAPGNFIRAKDPSEPFQGFLLWNLIVVNSKFILFGWPLVFLCAIFAYQFKDMIKVMNTSKRWQWFLTALATASPFALLNGFTSPRTAIFFHAFFSILLISCFKILFDKFSYNVRVSKFLSITVVIVFFVMISKDHYEAISYSEEYSAQIEQMEKNRGTRKKLYFIKKHFEPKSLRITNFSHEANFSANECAAIYFDLESIQYNIIPKRN